MLLNLRETDQNKIYVTSDFHFGHKREFVWKDRGYANVQEHDDAIINILNAMVRPTDTLLFLGDFCLNTTIDQFNDYLSRIKCQNILSLFGNHNNPHQKNVYEKMVPPGAETYPVKYKNLTYYGHYLEAILNGQYAVLCHYPIFVWNEMKHGAWMLCGHSHYSFPQTQQDNSYGKILDVGWDGHAKPYTLEEIKTIMDTKQFVPVDHHE